jgi:hypothetical protein
MFSSRVLLVFVLIRIRLKTLLIISAMSHKKA